jgi:DNA polymerase-1
LQQVPAKDDKGESVGTYGTECRSCFIPEEGCWYGKIDYSQIEYRCIAHYSIGEKSDEIKRTFNDNPHTDYHALVQRWIKEVTGTDLDRKFVKNLNFGTAYYMGVDSMSKKFGWPHDQSKELNRIYFETFPFLKPTRNEVVNTAKMRGYVRTVLGRRARVSREMRENKKEYVVWNYLVQGTAADIMKKAIVDAWNAGIFTVLVPHITVHDELGVSIPKTLQGVEAYRELKHVMENVVKLKVPIIAEAEIGPSWGETEACDFDKLKEML